MEVVYKYKLEKSDSIIELPINSKILSAIVLNGEIFIYALVSTNIGVIKNKFHFQVVATGEQISFNNYSFIDTVNIDPFIFHIFYRSE